MPTKEHTKNKLMLFHIVFLTIVAVPPCDENHFTCASGRCIPNTFLCDGEHDCGLADASDESDDICEGICYYNKSIIY